jgi:hypothetical protein
VTLIRVAGRERAAAGKGGVAVMPWKKIASLFAVSMSLGILSASCAAKVEEQRAMPDDAEPAEACDATEAADDVEITAAPREDVGRDRVGDDHDRGGRDRGPRDRDPREVEQCQRRCDAFYFQCLNRAEHRRERRERCDQVHEECRRDCERRRRF